MSNAAPQPHQPNGSGYAPGHLTQRYHRDVTSAADRHTAAETFDFSANGDNAEVATGSYNGSPIDWPEVRTSSEYSVTEPLPAMTRGNGMQAPREPAAHPNAREELSAGIEQRSRTLGSRRYERADDGTISVAGQPRRPQRPTGMARTLDAPSEQRHDPPRRTDAPEQATDRDGEGRPAGTRPMSAVKVPAARRRDDHAPSTHRAVGVRIKHHVGAADAWLQAGLDALDAGDGRLMGQARRRYYDHPDRVAEREQADRGPSGWARFWANAGRVATDLRQGTVRLVGTAGRQAGTAIRDAAGQNLEAIERDSLRIHDALGIPRPPRPNTTTATDLPMLPHFGVGAQHAYIGWNNDQRIDSDTNSDDHDNADDARSQQDSANDASASRQARPALPAEAANTDMAQFPRRADDDDNGRRRAVVPAQSMSVAAHRDPDETSQRGHNQHGDSVHLHRIAEDAVTARPDHTEDFYTRRARDLYKRDKGELGDDLNPETWMREQAHTMRTSDANNGYRMIGQAVFNAQRQEPAYRQELAAQREAARIRDQEPEDPFMVEAGEIFKRDRHLIPEEMQPGWVEGIAHGLREQARQKAAAEALEEQARNERIARERQAVVDQAHQYADTLGHEYQNTWQGPRFPSGTNNTTRVLAMQAAAGLTQYMRANYRQQWDAHNLNIDAQREHAEWALAAAMVRLGFTDKLNKMSYRLMTAAFAREMLGMDIAYN